jgi:small subunit ribosomal protein S18
MSEIRSPKPSGRPTGPGGPRGARRGFRRKVCRFCVDQVRNIDYKQVQIIRTFMTERGKILGRRITGTCAGHQRQITRCIKRTRNLSLVPFVNA